MLQWVEEHIQVLINDSRKGANTVEREPHEQHWVEVGSVGLSRKFAEAKERWRATRRVRKEEGREEEEGGFHLQEEVKREDVAE